MFLTRLYLSLLAVFVILVSKGSQACFRRDGHENKSIATGNSFYIECECTESGYTIENIKWIDENNQPIPLGPGTDTNVYTEEQGDSNIINLHIPSISKAIAGTYKCVTEVDGTRYTQSYTIDAYEPVYFYKSPVDQYATEHEDFLINCEAKADTSPLITWQKGENELIEITDDDKYQIMTQGLLIKNITQDDAGTYKCTALVVSTGEEADKFIKLGVMTIPVITELKVLPGPTVVVGERLSIECIADGVPHPEYKWKKVDVEGVEVKYNTTWRQNVNTIIFDNITAEDRGFYECAAINDAGFNLGKILVEVLEAPVITHFPNITEKEGTLIQLNCSSTGRSEPNVSIIYIGKDLNTDTFDDEFPNNVMMNLERSQEGYYICTASNEVSSVEQNMYLSVLHRPYFENPQEEVWGWDGSTVNLSCNHESNPRADITWRFERNDIPTDQQVEINKQLLDMLNGMPEHFLTLNMDRNSSYGEYECTAKNEYGEATKIIKLKEGFLPTAVNSTDILDITATSVLFEIKGPFEYDGPLIKAYTAMYDKAANFDITDIHMNRTWTIDRPFKLDKLKPNTMYRAKFAAVSEMGTGVWSNYLEFDTLDKSVPEPPVWEVHPITVTDNGHSLKWKAPVDNGEPIDYYFLRYCQDNDEELCKIQQISSTTEIKLTDLELNTTYSLELIAHNAEGNSTTAYVANITVPAPEAEIPTTLLSGEVIIGISVVLVVVCLLLLDLLLLVWRRQGIIASICLKKDKKKKADEVNTRDKKGLLNAETDEARRTNNGHKEYQYNKSTGVVTGKHSAV